MSEMPKIIIVNKSPGDYLMQLANYSEVTSEIHIQYRLRNENSKVIFDQVMNAIKHMSRWDVISEPSIELEMNMRCTFKTEERRCENKEKLATGFKGFCTEKVRVECPFFKQLHKKPFQVMRVTLNK